jgi:hypothetical protein
MNWLEIGLGVALMAGSVANVVPGDEVIGVPIGALLVAHGAGVF